MRVTTLEKQMPSHVRNMRGHFFVVGTSVAGEILCIVRECRAENQASAAEEIL